MSLHRLDHHPSAGVQADPGVVDVLQFRLGQTFQQGDTRVQCVFETNLSAHCGLGDGHDLITHACEVGDFVDALDRDHGRIHIRDQQAFAPVG